MFTVCPKCSLTLVVTAADLRVSQGYVRCGRCSNVFNALSRLSEDRQAGAPTPGGAPAQPREAAEPPASAAKPAAPEPMRYGDDTEIPEEDLEFNADATDLNKVFVEPPPSPKFTAATGTFKAIRMGAEDARRVEEELARTDEREIPSPPDDTFDPVDTQVDVEIDPDLLATMAHLTDNRQERLNPTPESAFSAAVFGEPDAPPATAEPAPEPPAPPPPKPTNSTSATGTMKALAAPKTPTPAKALLLQPPVEQPPQAPPPMRLAERAKARAEAARTGADPARALEATAKKPDPKPKPEALKPAAV